MKVNRSWACLEGFNCKGEEFLQVSFQQIVSNLCQISDLKVTFEFVGHLDKLLVDLPILEEVVLLCSALQQLNHILTEVLDKLDSGFRGSEKALPHICDFRQTRWCSSLDERVGGRRQRAFQNEEKHWNHVLVFQKVLPAVRNVCIGRLIDCFVEEDTCLIKDKRFVRDFKT